MEEQRAHLFPGLADRDDVLQKIVDTPGFDEDLYDLVIQSQSKRFNDQRTDIDDVPGLKFLGNLPHHSATTVPEEDIMEIRIDLPVDRCVPATVTPVRCWAGKDHWDYVVYPKIVLNQFPDSLLFFFSRQFVECRDHANNPKVVKKEKSALFSGNFPRERRIVEIGHHFDDPVASFCKMSIFTIFPYPKEDEEKLTRKECPHCLKKLDEKPVERVPENPTLNERIWGRWRQSGPYTSRQITCMGVSMGVAAGGFWIFYGFIILAIIAPPGATSSSEHPGSLLEQAKILRAVPAVLISALIPSFPLIYASLLLPCTSRKTAFGLFVFAQFLVLIIVPILTRCHPACRESAGKLGNEALEAL
ncbi:unnamed protein product, partial [Mesorhabditis belari]|uniref:Uncharacterized protein n=1 Tax=Mesorhabditis belari TaxID=2138241 RepID=A0AAF3EXR3_9BILA